MNNFLFSFLLTVLKMIAKNIILRHAPTTEYIAIVVNSFPKKELINIAKL